MKFTNRKILEMSIIFEALAQKQVNVRFAYAMAKNKAAIEKQAKILREASMPSTKYLEYEQKRVSLGREMADKDEKGKPLADGPLFRIPDIDKFNERWDELKEEYKEVIKAREKQLKDFEEIMDKQVDIKGLETVAFEDLPEQISSAEMSALMPLIIKEEKKKK